MVDAIWKSKSEGTLFAILSTAYTAISAKST